MGWGQGWDRLVPDATPPASIPGRQLQSMVARVALLVALVAVTATAASYAMRRVPVE